MILTEDFTELHRRSEKEIGFAEGKAEGEEKGTAKGKYIMLLQIVCKMLQKGMAVEEIAGFLEQDTSEIARICRAAEEFAPDYDCELIYQKMQK